MHPHLHLPSHYCNAHFVTLNTCLHHRQADPVALTVTNSCDIDEDKPNYWVVLHKSGRRLISRGQCADIGDKVGRDEFASEYLTLSSLVRTDCHGLCKTWLRKVLRKSPFVSEFIRGVPCKCL